MALKGSLISHSVAHRKDAKDAEAFFLLSVDPRGIGCAFHRAGRTESKKTQSCMEIKRLYNLSMYHNQSNARLAQAIIAAKLGLPRYSLMVYGINQLPAKAPC